MLPTNIARHTFIQRTMLERLDSSHFASILSLWRNGRTLGESIEINRNEKSEEFDPKITQSIWHKQFEKYKKWARTLIRFAREISLIPTASKCKVKQNPRTYEPHIRSCYTHTKKVSLSGFGGPASVSVKIAQIQTCLPFVLTTKKHSICSICICIVHGSSFTVVNSFGFLWKNKQNKMPCSMFD